MIHRHVNKAIDLTFSLIHQTFFFGKKFTFVFVPTQAPYVVIFLFAVVIVVCNIGSFIQGCEYLYSYGSRSARWIDKVILKIRTGSKPLPEKSKVWIYAIKLQSGHTPLKKTFSAAAFNLVLIITSVSTHFHRSHH